MPFASRSLRTPLLLAFVALLLLRVWVGDAMALGRIAPGAPAPAAMHAMAAADSADGIAAMAPPPCHETASAPAGGTVAAGHGSAHAVPDTHTHGAPHEAGHGASHSAGDACGTCTLCQVCHSVALAEAGGGAPVFALPQAAPHHVARHDASAEPVPGFKPPIS